MYQGAICDDTSACSKMHEMMSILTSKANREKDDVSGFGRRWDSDDCYPTITGSTLLGLIHLQM